MRSRKALEAVTASKGDDLQNFDRLGGAIVVTATTTTPQIQAPALEPSVKDAPLYEAFPGLSFRDFWGGYVLADAIAGNNPYLKLVFARQGGRA
jgi:hypothetical protein